MMKELRSLRVHAILPESHLQSIGSNADPTPRRGFSPSGRGRI
jgi:hypothetical protein